MIHQVKRLLAALPFVPFKIKTSDVKEYLIPTSDHAAVFPNNSRVLILGDDGSQITLAGLHVVAVEESAGSVR